MTEEKKVQKKGPYHYAVGKRKNAVAQVRLYLKGSGEFVVNKKPMKEYFHTTYIGNILTPLKLTGLNKKFDITVLVKGGGYSSQSDAIRHGISRALVDFDKELRAQLKKDGLITRDSRVKERKKPGLKRARKAPQWAKR